MMLSLLLGTGMTAFTGCSDDEASSNVLLRPVTTMVTDMNHVQLSWKAVPDATEYIVDIYRVTDGANELYQSVTTSETSITLDLEWDESYQVKIKCRNNGVESAYWETDPITLIYPSIFGSTRSIDTQALVSWTPSDEFAISALTAIPIDDAGNDAGETLTFEVTPDEYAAGEKILTGLEPNTTYKISAYSGEVNLDNYRGRVMVSTSEAEDLEAEYGSNLIDLRNEPYDEEYFNTKVDWAGLPEGATFVLPEGRSYVVNRGTAVELTKSVHFVTPQTLGEYATLRFDNAFRVAEGMSVDRVSFKRMNLQALKTLADITDTGMSGKQVICPEASAYSISDIQFTDCNIENFRAVVRTKADGGNFGTISFKNCTLNAIGNQGIVSTDGKQGSVTSMSMDECTITNSCGIADLRNENSSTGGVTLTNCTFCYTPADGSFLFRVAYNIPVNIENCVFGASMKLNGKLPLFNQIGSGAQDDYTGNHPFTPVNSYKTSDQVSTKGNLGLSGSNMDTNTLFQDPANNDFKLNNTFSGCSSTGASKWRVQ